MVASISPNFSSVLSEWLSSVTCTSTVSPRPSASGFRRSEEHTSELQSHSDLVCRLLLEKKKKMTLALRRTSRSDAVVALDALIGPCLHRLLPTALRIRPRTRPRAKWTTHQWCL